MRRQRISWSLIGLYVARGKRRSGRHEHKEGHTERELHKPVKERDEFIYDAIRYF